MPEDNDSSSSNLVEGQVPRSFEALKASLLGRRSTLPKRLSQVAIYMLNHPEEIAFGTAASIAISAHVQPSTLVRFAQHLGYEGFSDIQQVFRDRLRTPPGSYDERLAAIRSGDAAPHANDVILKGFFLAASQSITKLSNTISMANFRRAVAILAKSETIYIVARRRAYPVASNLAYALGKLGLRYVLTGSAAGLDADAPGFAKAGDGAIIISFAPYATEAVELAQLLVKRGIPIVSMTDSIFSPLAECASEWLEVDEVDFSGFRSLSASMALAMALAVAIAEARRARDSAQNAGR
jgi:DNA-binding MurR/RpiR family transcriptional regulator